MIIECGACNSRFRLDDSKITGRGARVRCRKCGEAITVMKEDADAQAGTGAARPGEQEEGLDLRSILRESMEAPLTLAPTATDGQVPRAQDAQERPPAAEPPGTDELQADFDRAMADGGKEADARPDAPPAAAPPEQPQTGGPTVDFGPEEELTFPQPGRQDARELPAAGAIRKTTPAPPVQPPPPAAPASEFMMSTADSLDFLKADYDQEGQKAALDISGSLRIAPAPGADDARVAPPLGTQAPTAGHPWPSAAGAGGAGAAAPAPPAEPPSRSDAIRSELAGIGGAGAAGAASAGTAAAPPRAKAAAPPAFPPLRETTEPKRSPAVRKAPAKKDASLKRGQGSQLVRPSVVLLLLLFFALAGGGAYLGFTSDGQKVLRGLVPQIESLWLGGGKPASRYEVGNLIGYYETTPAAGKMFIIKGQVTNEGRLRKVGVRVSAILLDAQNRNVAEKTVYAGNVLAGDAFRKAAREKIEAAMHNPIGGGLANVDLAPGKSVPFMVVFFDVPDGIDSYRLEPKDVD